MDNRIWFKTPGDTFEEGLPIGTGRLAAMVLGQAGKDRLILNHEWLWRGKYRVRAAEHNAHLLPEVRKLLLSGRFEEGTLRGNEAFGGCNGVPHRVDAYQPAGELFHELEHGPATNYRRELDLTTATVRVSYDTDTHGMITLDYMAHPGHDLIMLRITPSVGCLSGLFRLGRVEDPECELRFSGDDGTLIMTGAFVEGIEFRVESTFQVKGGTLTTNNEQAVICDATEIRAFINIGTSAKGETPDAECRRHSMPTGDWEAFRATHEQAYSRVMDRVRLDIPGHEQSLSTDQMWQAARDGALDPALTTLYFNYGRYLLYASSATAELPANLQGKWNESLTPPWDSDYHFDINLQFSYWLAEPVSMQEYAEPLFAFLERMVPSARIAARNLYDCRGIWFPIQCDPWAQSTPESFGFATWIGSAPWISQHFWWHYEYSQDEGFLKERAYPFLKEIATFYEDYLVADEQGVLQIVPSQSPENRFVGSGEKPPVSLCVSSAMDVELATEVLQHCIQAAEILNVDADCRARWQEMLERLPPLRIGADGRLLEWNMEVEERNRGHRHLSHLMGLYPSDQFTQESTPSLFEAAGKSLDGRLRANGFMSGRLTRAWVPCIFARMRRGDHAQSYLLRSIINFAPKDEIFHTDIMHAVPAAVCEMLLHSYHEKLRFLPALPKAWPEGSIRGLRARGGYTVDIEWQDGKLSVARIRCVKGRRCVVKTDGEIYSVADSDGCNVLVDRVGRNEFSFMMDANDTYFLHQQIDD